MKIGVISDIHGNIVALETVLDDMPEVDRIASLGDVVGYGPAPRECVERIQETTVTSLYGNHESYLSDPDSCKGNFGAYKGILHARGRLTSEQLDWCADRPWEDQIETLGMVHGHPDPNHRFAYVKPRNVAEMVPYLNDRPYDILAVGHSHIQFKQDLSQFSGGNGIVFNPGSVGQPRDKDPRAGYAVVDTEEQTVDLHRVEYDVPTVVEAIYDADLPSVNAERLKQGRYPDKRRRRR